MSSSHNSGLDTVIIDGTPTGRETPDAEEVAIDAGADGFALVWLPKKQYHRPPAVDEEGNGGATYFIPLWLAEKLGANYNEYDPDDWEEEEEEALDFNN